LQVICS